MVAVSVEAQAPPQLKSSPQTQTQTTTTTTAPPLQPPAAQHPDPDAALKRMQIIVAILGGLLAILTGFITLMLFGRKGMAWAVFTPLESVDGRERLMKLIHSQLDSTVGHQIIAKYALAHYKTEGSKDFQEFILGLVERLVVEHSQAQGLIAKNISMIRDETPKKKRAQGDRVVQESTIAGQAETPIANAEEFARNLERIAADVRAQIKKQT